EAVIESKARVTYGEAQEIVDGNDIEKFNHVKENIFRCADLAKVLMARRFKDGSLDLEVPETELVIDGTGEPIDVIKSERLFAHRLIEELMLAANVAVAKYLGGKDIPSMYRIHEPPDPMKISLLQKFIGQLGSKAKFSGEKLQKQLTKALQEFHGKPQASIIHILTLRSMSQAKYTIDNLGHFGLGFDFYTHFTSPIRRYPDLIVHRLIKNQIGVPGYRLLAADDLQTAGTWLSACEQRSAKSERQIQAIKKARFMKKMEGQTFDGMISSITKFGLFVLLKQYNVDGLVRLEDLGTNNSWVYDEENLRLVSKKSGYAYNIGDSLKVTVSMVDIEQGQINFVPEGVVAKIYDKSDKNYRPEKAEIKTNRKFEDKKLNMFGKKGTGSHFNDKREENKPAAFVAKKPTASSDSIKKSLRLRTIEKNAETNKPEVVNDYEVKPRYSSLSDYLDKNKMKPTEETYDKKPSYKSSTNEKSSAQSFKGGEDSQKRGKTPGHPSGAGKTRSKQSGRKNKSR
ncbi:MAG: RNB domain-containing ribonuclease, partial [Bdellovibrionaceae bacterium]|nr:RNB domain-containing ribonuclease [Pseudobdellovibrionaceae bacterium]